MRAGPHAKLLTVVTANGDCVRNFVREVAQERDAGIRLFPGNRVAQPFGDWENRQQLPFVFREVMPEEFFWRQPRVAKVRIIEHRELDPCCRDIGGEGLFPNPLRHPHATHRFAEQCFQIIRVKPHLPDSVSRWNARQDRLIKRTAKNLDLPAVTHFSQRVDVLRMRGHEPFQQAAGVVDRHLNVGILAQHFEERRVAVAIGLFKDTLEVADWLMIMKDERESNRWRHRRFLTSGIF